MSRRIDVRDLVTREFLPPQGLGPPCRVEASFLLPLFERVIVRYLASPKSRLKVGQGMGRSEKMLARSHLSNRVHGLTLFRQIDPREQSPPKRTLIGVDDEFLVPHGEPTFEPPRGVENEIRSGH